LLARRSAVCHGLRRRSEMLGEQEFALVVLQSDST
jgi:hypothetical protein